MQFLCLICVVKVSFYSKKQIYIEKGLFIILFCPFVSPSKFYMEEETNVIHSEGISKNLF